jgi:hypothetical protein
MGCALSDVIRTALRRGRGKDEHLHMKLFAASRCQERFRRFGRFGRVEGRVDNVEV